MADTETSRREGKIELVIWPALPMDGGEGGREKTISVESFLRGICNNRCSE